MLNISALQSSLVSAGLPVADLSTQRIIGSDPLCTYYPAPDGSIVRVHWTQQPTAPQDAQATNIIAAYTPPAPTAGDKLDGQLLPPRAVAAAIVRASTQWATLTVGQKAAVQQYLDTAAAAIIQAALS